MSSPGPPLRLRQPQWRALRAMARERFVAHTLTVVEVCWPATFRSRGREAMRSLVERALLAARGFGVTDRAGVLRWVNLTLALGEDFPARPWAARILERPDLRSATKMDLLTERAARVIAAEDGR